MPDKRPDDDWPQKGAVEFCDYSTRYRKGLGLVLRNISVKVNPGEKASDCQRRYILIASAIHRND